MIRLRNLLLVAAAGALAVTHLTPGVGASHSADPAAHPVPVIDLELDDAKAMVVRLHMTGPGTATLVGAQVVFGRSRGLAGEPPLLRIRVHNDTAGLTRQFQAWDPRWIESENSPGGSMSTDIVPAATGEYIFPFTPDIETLTVFNLHENTAVGSFDLGAAVQEFCEDHPSDPDCRTDLRISKSDVDPAVAGTVLAYTLEVTNLGPNPAHSPRVVDTLPAGLTFVGGSSTCSALGLVVTCDLDGMPSGTSTTVTINALIDPALVYDAGAPTTITNTATVVNLAGVDLDSSDNIDSESTAVFAEADLEVVSTATVDPPPDILIGDDVDVTLRAVVTSHGPSSPMDADLERDATSEPGASITPSSTTETVVAVEDGVTRVVDTVFTISCAAPGEHTFTFTDTVSPTRPDDLDPNPTNDTGTTSLTVDCVVPVKLDIHPKKLNLKSNGSVPMTVLTTEAGEYGLPLAFDASTIQPTTVRFGQTDVAWMNGGSFEVHGRGHGANGNGPGMVLHHPLAGTGLTTADDEGCVKGKFTGPGGETWTFFGCDDVQVR